MTKIGRKAKELMNRCQHNWERDISLKITEEKSTLFYACSTCKEVRPIEVVETRNRYCQHNWKEWKIVRKKELLEQMEQSGISDEIKMTMNGLDGFMGTQFWTCPICEGCKSERLFNDKVWECHRCGYLLLLGEDPLVRIYCEKCEEDIGREGLKKRNDKLQYER